MLPIATHPAAEMFPLLGDDELRELADDIAAHGLREPIVVQGGTLIDGRNRLRACVMAGVEPTTVELPNGTDPVGYIVSANIHRRHLTTSQRAMLAARLATLSRGEIGNGRKVDPQKCGPISTAQAAKTLAVSPRSVEQAKQVVQHGTPALVAAVHAGDVAVSRAADIATTVEPDQQMKAIAEALPRVCEHHWVSDGHGSRYCQHCMADHPGDAPPEAPPATAQESLDARALSRAREALGVLARSLPREKYHSAKPHLEALRKLLHE